MPFSMKLLCIPKQNWSSNSLLLSFLDTVFHCPLSCQFSLQLKHQPLVAESKSNRAMLLNLKFLGGVPEGSHTSIISVFRLSVRPLMEFAVALVC